MTRADIEPAALESLWAETNGEEAICVAVLDGPVDTSHSCFSGANLQLLETLVPHTVDGGPAAVHGTHVASVLFGQPSSPVQGIVPGCRGLILPVFTSAPNGGIMPCSQVDLARAITSAVEHGANVINISGGELSASNEADRLLENAVQYCADNGVLIVAAAGNDGCECLHVPAALSAVLAVGASDAQGRPLDSSNWGVTYQTQGILASGEKVLGAVPQGRVAELSGTSFATPVVSGVVALLLSLQLKMGQAPDPHAVRDAILASAHPCDPQVVDDCHRFLAGRLNIDGARQMSIGVNPSSPSPRPAAQAALSDSSLPFSEGMNGVEHTNHMDEIEQKFQGIEPQAEVYAEVVEEDEPIVESSVAPLTASPETVTRVPAAVPPAIVSPAVPALMPSGVRPASDLSAGSLVYALGALGFDFGTEARRDSITQSMTGNAPNPNDTTQLMAHLEANPWDAEAIHWTLTQESTPIYAIKPQGPYAAQTYERLRAFLKDHIEDGVERVSVPGTLSGQVRLGNGQVVPLIIPEVRGMFSWNTDDLVEKLHGVRPATQAVTDADTQRKVDGTRNFLERVYYELRNLGVTAQERAINFSATKAFHIEAVFEETSREEMELDTIHVEQSPLCRPESDCWDVKLSFFNPAKRMEQAKRIYRFTIDVSDVIPVTIGAVRSWSEYN